MAEEVSQWPGFRFTLEEISGSFGDSITVIPLLIGIGVATDASFAHMLLFFAIFQIVNGLFYSLPMPVKPMKALAALAIAGILGTIYLGIAFIAGSASFLSFYPVAALGALLVFIALELASAGAKTDKWINFDCSRSLICNEPCDRLCRRTGSRKDSGLC